MSRRAGFTQAALVRALKAAEKAGVAVGAVDIMPDGKFTIIARDAADNRSELERWKARRRA